YSTSPRALKRTRDPISSASKRKKGASTVSLVWSVSPRLMLSLKRRYAPVSYLRSRAAAGGAASIPSAAVSAATAVHRARAAPGRFRWPPCRWVATGRRLPATVEHHAGKLLRIKVGSRLRDRVGAVSAVAGHHHDQIREAGKDSCVGRGADRGCIQKQVARRVPFAERIQKQLHPV